MSPTAVLTAVDHRHEADLVAGLEGQPDVEVVRRCADVAELLSVAGAGSGDVALISASFRGIDREVLRSLAGHGVRVVGVVEAGDESAERTLRQFGVQVFVPPAVPAADLVAALAGAAGRAGVPGLGGSGPGGVELAARMPGDVLSLGVAAELTTPSPSVADGAGEGDWGGDAGASIVAVWGPTGAPGRTTVAVTLAAILAAASVPTLLIDLDTYGASVAQTLGVLDEAPGVASAARLSEHGTLDLLALSRVAPEVSPGLRVLTGLPQTSRWPELRPASVTDMLGIARHLARVVVVDCGFSLENDEELSYDTSAPRRNAATLTALTEADQRIVVGAGDPVGIQRLIRGLAELAEADLTATAVVVNKVRAGVAGSHPERSIRDLLARFAGVNELWVVPWAPQECDAALWAGRTLVESAPDSPVVRAVRDIALLVSPLPVAPAGRRRRDRSRHRG